MADTSETSPTGSKPFYILLRRPDISSVLGNVATTARPITTLDVKLCNLIGLQVLPHNRAVTRTQQHKKRKDQIEEKGRSPWSCSFLFHRCSLVFTLQ